jgi:hypothetical protein
MSKQEALINGRSQQMFLEALNGVDDSNLGWWIFGSKEKAKDQPVIKYGAQGDAVELLQEKLEIKVDGKFEGGTEAALKQYQRNNGLDDTGIADRDTWSTLFGEKTAAEKQAAGEKTASTLTDIFNFGTQTVQQLSAGDPNALDLEFEEEEEEEEPPNYLLWGLGGLTLLVVVGGGIYLMTRDGEKE